ncbi:ATP-grasp domain-containing protein [Streptomyces ovatisporus]|uniref:ATP-grasp domain-containing protein n=1 Tax=Streptomyces ovatisporus TaxID=1128682 RepID=A0ABV9A9Q7_9ACTN
MPTFDTEVPVLLLRLDPNQFHHGTLGAVRSLGRTGIKVHVALESAQGPLGRCRFLHRVHALPPGGTSEAELESALFRISESIGRPAVLIALDDRSALAVAALSPRLTGRYLLPGISPGLPARVADKAELSLLCRETGIAHPTTVAPRSAGEAAGQAVALGLPAVAKWSRPWLLPEGMRSTTLVRTPEDAFELFGRSAQAGSQLLLQRRIPGGHGTDWFFHGYAAERGRFLTGGAGRKEMSWPPRTGMTAVGTWLANREVEEAAARLAAEVDYRGILDLDFRLDPVTGTYHLLDFNPRPGAQFRLFTDDTGLDVVRAQHLHLTGRAVPAQRGGPGRVFVAENYALLSALVTTASLGLRTGDRDRGSCRAPARPPGCEHSREHGREHGCEHGRGGAREHRVRGRRGRVEGAWFSFDDPRPFFAMAAAWFVHCMSKVWRSVRKRLPGLPACAAAALPPAPHFRTPRDERSVNDQREGNACTTS